MLIRMDDGTYLAGPLDAILILRHTQTGRYHAALFLERAFPGPPPPYDEVPVVRLVSHGHHTEGSDTLEGAQTHVDELKAKIDVHGNVFRAPVDWDGRYGVLLLRENRHRDPSWRPEIPGFRAAAPVTSAPRPGSEALASVAPAAPVTSTAPTAPIEDDARTRFSLLELD
jgi:hypothetical protein